LSSATLKINCLLAVLVSPIAFACWTDGPVAMAQQPTTDPLTRIVFGSCIKQDQPMTIFQVIEGWKPDLNILLGDNIYADTVDMDVMREKYSLLKNNADFAKFARSAPLLVTWDDHDFGQNDAGASYPQRKESEEIFLDIWGVPADSPVRTRPGIYDSKVYGPVGKRVQVILLDTRYFRGPLKSGEKRTGGPYYPTDDTSITMLGEPQWNWLEKQLQTPAELRILGSSIQCIAESAGQETWSNLPHERERLFKLLKKTSANGVVIVSGDRHWAELSTVDAGLSYPLYDITSSSFNQLHARGTPTQNKYRASPKTYHRENFGGIVIDWTQTDPGISLQILGIDGKVHLEKNLQLSDLQ